MNLNNKKILIGVTGSIAIYKSLELIRLYIKAGANVKVIMTKGAKKFITPLSFETISQARVLDDENESWDKDSVYNHIAIGKWADVFVLAPITANTINKLSNGIADNILTQTVLAYPGLKLISPAANTNMIQNPITKKSIEKLNLENYKIVEPISKELACRDVGVGAMADVEDIFYATARELLKDDYWLNRKVVLSGGGTVEKIDDVRYLSNFSSGKMASSLAKALYLKGADVYLVSSRGYEDLPKLIHTIKAQSSDEMYEHLQNALTFAKKDKISKEKKPYLFMVAAISDYIPKNPQEGKMKKTMIGDTWNLELKQNIDVLSSLDKRDIYSIGFKAEMDALEAQNSALKMLDEKRLDGVCLNILDDKDSFGTETNAIDLLINKKTLSFSGEKLSLSLKMLDSLKLEFNE